MTNGTDQPSSNSATPRSYSTTVGAPIPLSIRGDIEDAVPAPSEVAAINDLALKLYPRPRALQSLKYLYRTGYGPSSSHTLAPGRAANRVAQRITDAGIKLNEVLIIVELYGSLAATGKGHLTDKAIEQKLEGCGELIVDWRHGEKLPEHTNGMRFLVYPLAPVELHPRTADVIVRHFASERVDTLIEPYIAYSIGGGALRDSSTRAKSGSMVDQAIYEIYPFTSTNELLDITDREGVSLWQIVEKYEGEIIWEHMHDVWETMKASVERGISTFGALPEMDGIHVPRKAARLYAKAKRSLNSSSSFYKTSLIMAYAHAVSEENGCASGEVVTAPTCGSAGVIPGLLYFLQEDMDLSDRTIHEALCVAGLFGTIAKGNASISGAEAGCQAEIGVATAMAAAAAVYIMGGTPRQSELAAESALESCTGLDCTPIAGRVLIPCIERCALYATRALDCAALAHISGEQHFVSYDEALLSMKLAGMAMREEFRETSLSGYASVFNLDRQLKEKQTRAQYTGEKVERFTSDEVHTLNYDEMIDKLRTSSNTSSNSSSGSSSGASSDEDLPCADANQYVIPLVKRLPDVCD